MILRGKKNYKAISLNYLRDADVANLVFDITKRETFDLIESWLKELQDTNKSDISKILIGNKEDLENERLISTEKAEELAETMKCKYFEASAKTGKNVIEALDEIARITFNDYINSNRVESFVLCREEKKKILLMIF